MFQYILWERKNPYENKELDLTMLFYEKGDERIKSQLLCQLSYAPGPTMETPYSKAGGECRRVLPSGALGEAGCAGAQRWGSEISGFAVAADQDVAVDRNADQQAERDHHAQHCRAAV
jgi:hypothetical protein